MLEKEAPVGCHYRRTERHSKCDESGSASCEIWIAAKIYLEYNKKISKKQTNHCDHEKKYILNKSENFPRKRQKTGKAFKKRINSVSFKIRMLKYVSRKNAI